MTSTTAATQENKIRQLVGNIRNLPTPPIVFEQIQRILNNPDTSVGDVAKILSEDPAMSVKVLKLTNSAFYGLQREVDSVKHAVMIIGLEAVKNLVLSASVLNMFKADKSNKDYHERFWRHSLSTAFAARIIAKEFQGGKVFNPDPAFSTGLIHDIGKMIICCFMQKEHQKVQEHLEGNPHDSDMQAEDKVLGFNHCQIGKELVIQWKLPTRMADALAYHHNPTEPNDSEDFAYIINLANNIAHLSTIANDDEAERLKPDERVMKFFGIDESDIDSLKASLIQEYMKAETFMRIAGIS